MIQLSRFNGDRDDERGQQMVMGNEILEVSGPSHGYYNFEGESAKLGSGVFGRRTQGFPYFAFEEPWVVGCMELQKLGFTATQILEARDASEEEPEEREPYMTHSMLVAEQGIDEYSAWEDSQGLNDE